jgi:hypothetical protein
VLAQRPIFEGGHEEIISLATVPRNGWNVWNYWNRFVCCNDLNGAQRLNDLNVLNVQTSGTSAVTLNFEPGTLNRPMAERLHGLNSWNKFYGTLAHGPKRLDEA